MPAFSSRHSSSHHVDCSHSMAHKWARGEMPSMHANEIKLLRMEYFFLCIAYCIGIFFRHHPPTKSKSGKMSLVFGILPLLQLFSVYFCGRFAILSAGKKPLTLDFFFDNFVFSKQPPPKNVEEAPIQVPEKVSQKYLVLDHLCL